MTEAQTILQCGMCHRQHDGGGTVLEFRFCTPEIVACGRADCAAVVQELLSREAARRNDKVEKCQVSSVRREEQSRRACVRQGHGIKPAARQCDDSTLPRGDRFDAPEVARPVFVGADDSAESQTQCEWMLRRLLESFDVNDPTRSVASAWLSNAQMVELRLPNIPHGITRPNSRASQLNGSKTLETHPLLKEHRLYIECDVVPEIGVARRLVFAENIAREAIREKVLVRYRELGNPQLL